MNVPTDKRIYRDVERGVIAGVCAGVARYLEVDSVWVRAAAVFAAFMLPGITLLAYLAAVFLLPRWSF
ncbi:PspC domain-containing protein [Alteromonas sp. CYL-A6]|uniref:PspC domain-containing protein n=1 Tax=Alteromonas nitratireducens TaxID=3390813 RepID=UPI0034B12483